MDITELKTMSLALTNGNCVCDLQLRTFSLRIAEKMGNRLGGRSFSVWPTRSSMAIQLWSSTCFLFKNIRDPIFEVGKLFSSMQPGVTPTSLPHLEEICETPLRCKVGVIVKPKPQSVTGEAGSEDQDLDLREHTDPCLESTLQKIKARLSRFRLTSVLESEFYNSSSDLWSGTEIEPVTVDGKISCIFIFYSHLGNIHEIKERLGSTISGHEYFPL